MSASRGAVAGRRTGRGGNRRPGHTIAMVVGRSSPRGEFGTSARRCSTGPPPSGWSIPAGLSGGKFNREVDQQAAPGSSDLGPPFPNRVRHLRMVDPRGLVPSRGRVQRTRPAYRAGHRRPGHRSRSSAVAEVAPGRVQQSEQTAADRWGPKKHELNVQPSCRSPRGEFGSRSAVSASDPAPSAGDPGALVPGRANSAKSISLPGRPSTAKPQDRDAAVAQVAAN